MSIINNNKIFVLFAIKENVLFVKKTHFFEEELRNRWFNTSNSHVLIWNITYMRKNMNNVCLRSVSKNMSEELVIKYNVANDWATEPRKVTIDSVGHDIFGNFLY